MRFERVEYDQDNINRAVQEYINTGKSAMKIAKEYGITKNVINYHYHKMQTVNPKIQKVTTRISEPKEINLSAKDKKLRSFVEQATSDQLKLTETPFIEVRKTSNSTKKKERININNYVDD